MSSIYDILGTGTSSYSSSDMYSTLFGTSSSNSTSSSSWLYSLGDLSMIRSGAYKKALKSYYSTMTKDEVKESISGSGTADSKNSLSALKSSATKLVNSADELKKTDYSKVEKASDLLDDVKSFVSDYNSTLSATKSLNSYSILQTAVWGTERMNQSEDLLNKAGITIKEDNTLSLDEEKFAQADVSTLKSLFSGSGSLADSISGKASSLAIQSANQIAVNSGNVLYNSSGLFA